MRVLGIETSCDETAVAIVEAPAGRGPVGTILANVVYSQQTEHRRFGGVVPEIAARAHLERIDGLVEDALAEAKLGLDDLDAIAATGGPGLIGGVMVGVMAAKGLAFARQKPFLAINHLEGHALSVRLTEQVDFPYLLLLVSGGHCQLLTVRGPGDFTRLGTTIDDAVGECFDKTAKLLGLGFPGGPAVERLATDGDARRFALPRPMWRKPGCDFSFSGLKTAVRQAATAIQPLSEQDVADICASFQHAVSRTLKDRIGRGLQRFKLEFPELQEKPALVVAGGVAANNELRGTLQALCDTNGFRFIAPPLHLCTDNAVMIAWAGLERMATGVIPDDLDVQPRSRWPLDANATALIGHGRRGAKA